MENGQKTVLVVDDERGIRESLKIILKNRYRILDVEGGEEGLELLSHNAHEIDVIFSDILMCQMNGIQFLEQVKKLHPFCEVIIMTAYPTMDTSVAALRLGAADYIVKPFGVEEVLEATRRAIDRKKTVIRNHDKIKELTDEIQKNYAGTTQALISAINARDQYTGGHSYRVSKWMARFGAFLNLDPELVRKLEDISYLHDVGKIGISEKILSKSSALSSEEFEEMKLHPFIGYKILQPVETLKDVLDVMLYHQEHFDGSGYPAGLKDYEIPLGARMLSVVDSYDAMTSTRPFRVKLTREDAVQELRKQAGIQYDPELVESFVRMIDNDPSPAVAESESVSEAMGSNRSAK